MASSVIAVVVNWNGWRDTIDCLESILQSDVAPEQTIVCDNGSTDGSLGHVRAWLSERGISFAAYSTATQLFHPGDPSVPIALVEIGTNLGYAGANNIGIAYALDVCDARYVWILNNDVVVERGALRAMLDLAQSDERIGLVGPKLLNVEAPQTIQAMGGGYIIPVICHDTQLGAGRPADSFAQTPIELDHLIGACLLARAAAIRSVGPIDESYFLYREETDWCIRMGRKGWKLYCCPAAVVLHKQSRSAGFKTPVHDYYAVRNMLHLVRKLYPASLPTAFAYFSIRSLVPKIVRLQFVRAGAVLAALRDFMSGVTGRAKAHTDAVLMREYVGGHHDLVEPASDRVGSEPRAEGDGAARESAP